MKVSHNERRKEGKKSYNDVKNFVGFLLLVIISLSATIQLSLFFSETAN